VQVRGQVVFVTTLCGPSLGTKRTEVKKKRQKKKRKPMGEVQEMDRDRKRTQPGTQ